MAIAKITTVLMATVFLSACSSLQKPKPQPATTETSAAALEGAAGAVPTDPDADEPGVDREPVQFATVPEIDDDEPGTAAPAAPEDSGDLAEEIPDDTPDDAISTQKNGTSPTGMPLPTSGPEVWTNLPPPPATRPQITQKSPSEPHATLCRNHFRERTQLSACAAGGQVRNSTTAAQTPNRCRSQFQDSARERLSCLIGAGLQDSLIRRTQEPDEHLALCRALYPSYSWVDMHLQESCIAGLKLPQLTGDKPSFALCERHGHDHSFNGPCSASLSFSQAPAENEAAARLINQICRDRFDHRQFHLGYRSCLNARGVTLEKLSGAQDMIRNCNRLVGDPSNEVEKAVCMVGVSLQMSLAKTSTGAGTTGTVGTKSAAGGGPTPAAASAEATAVAPGAASATAAVAITAVAGSSAAAATTGDRVPAVGTTFPTSKHIAACGGGEGKITFKDKNSMICMAAASLMEYGSRGQARQECKNMFPKRRSQNRKICEQSIKRF